ncbi:hypothetical protein HDU87_005684 [Geranomyces variabilis]|uniref:DAGKc domain-containing protein n=1 Tax=Geranomyces variabilis TaxID=109894 RepID=A0AAD5XKX1_9FUNG|nr:hypothetical protein HDU87_005684 [Geranomyces variabilis]
MATTSSPVQQPVDAAPAILAAPAYEPPRPVLAFYNAHSGSQRATALADLPSPSTFHYPTATSPPHTVYFYDIRKDETLAGGIQHVRTLVQSRSADSAGIKCFVVCCGGDGTVPAVLSALDKSGISKDGGGAGVVWTALPFGTANILPRFLGWGAGTSRNVVDELPALLHTITHGAPRVAVDSMRVTAVGRRSENDHDDEGEEEEEVTQFSLIQTAIGLEARLGRFVEDHRASKRLYTMSLSALNVVRQLLIPHPEINRVITNIHSPSTPDWSAAKHRSHRCIQINIQNIPVGGGKDHSLWNTAADAGEDPFDVQKVDDGKCEAFAYPNKGRFLWNNMWAAIGHGSKVEKIGQLALPVRIEFDSESPVLTETCMFVDGELIDLRRPRELRIESAGNITFAIHPDGLTRVQEYLSNPMQSSSAGKTAEKNDSAFRVFATARRLEAMTDLGKLGIETLALDVTSAESVAAILADVTERSAYGLDILINNAGQPFMSAALDIDLDRARQMFETNFWGVVRMNSAFQHLLVKAKGTIANVSSIGSFMPFVMNAAYTASKSALNAYTNTLRYELAPFGVKVVTLVTGGVRTNIMSKQVEKLQFPPNSLYAGVGDAIRDRIGGEFDKGMDVHEYADTVVRRLTGRGAWFQGWSRNALPAQMWVGGMAWTAWLGSFLPVEAYTPIQDSIFGLRKLLRVAERGQ